MHALTTILMITIPKHFGVWYLLTMPRLCRLSLEVKILQCQKLVRRPDSVWAYRWFKMFTCQSRCVTGRVGPSITRNKVYMYVLHNGSFITPSNITRYCTHENVKHVPCFWPRHTINRPRGRTLRCVVYFKENCSCCKGATLFFWTLSWFECDFKTWLWAIERITLEMR